MAEILLKLRGGLGNQLFQYSAGVFYARKLDAKLIIDDSSVYKHPDPTRRSWLKKIDCISTFGFSRVKWVQNSRRFYLKIQDSYFTNRIYVNEKFLESTNELLEPTKVFDWFHSKEYVESLRNSISSNSDFRLKLQFKDTTTNVELKLPAQKAAMHIRLGDFKGTTWGVLPSDWYLARVRTLLGEGIEEIDCYSDDLVALKEIVGKWNLKCNFRFPEYTDILHPHELLLALTRYPTFISSNSTLSWWGSYFNTNFSSKIYCNWNDSLRLKEWIYCK
jgi:hypothetical protein